MSVSLIAAAPSLAQSAPTAPEWAKELLGPEPCETHRRQEEGLEISVLEGSHRALISVVVPEVLKLSRHSFEEATTSAYEAIRRELQGRTASHPLRLWNFIPRLLSPLEELPHRYMAFNAGRYRSYSQWFDHGPDFARHIPTATGVGHDGGALLIHCLSCQSPGSAVENPRQISSYRYSHKFGPLPPCFARATRIGSPGTAESPPWLLVGGTASVKGEESVHGSDLEAQARETFLNLAAVVAAGERRMISDAKDSLDLWRRYRHLRIYYVNPEDLPKLSERVEAHFHGLESVEYRQADLCRPELLVEIEGVAELSATPPGDL